MSQPTPTRAALVTLVIGGKMPWLRHSEPWREAYAARHGLAYIRLTQPRLRQRVRWLKPRLNVSLEKFQIANLFSSFNRLMFVDADTILHPQAPNLFDLVPADHMGVVFEETEFNEAKRQEEWVRAQRRLGPLPVDPSRYFNSGVFVASAEHQPLFAMEGRRFAAGRWPDQTTLNYYATLDGIKLHGLPMEWNFTPVAGEAFQQAETRRRAWVLHYAGQETKALMAGDDAYFREAFGRPIDFATAS